MLLRKLLPSFLALEFVWLLTPGGVDAQVPRPEEIIGFELGTDHKLADYDQIHRYFRALAAASERVVLEEIGTSTLGRPMLLAFISSEENLRNRERFRDINQRLALARSLNETEARELAEEGLVTVWIDGGLHSSEVAHSQHTAELGYWLATDESAEARLVRDKVLLLLMPNINPDGLDIVTNWYRKNLGTPFETAPLPELYHHYVGHDNNRDWYMLSQAESQVAADVFYHRWFPQIIYNHHQTGPFPGRIWVPPPIDPLNVHFDPMSVAKLSHIGQYMLQRFMKEGKPGVSTAIGYRVSWSGGFMTTAPQLHNMLGLFTETALYRYATPHCYTDEEVGTTFTRGIPLPTREPSTHYPVPWEGGCWHLRDAMDYMMTGSRAVLSLASQLKEEYLYDIYHMGSRQIARGEAAEGGPFAYLIDPSEQHDPGAAVELLQIFRRAGIEIRRAETSFVAANRDFAPGTYVIPPQAFRPFVVDLMERREHPDRMLYPGGPPEPPYDVTGYNLPDQLGVVFHRAGEPFEMPGPTIDEVPPPPGEVRGPGRHGFVFSSSSNKSVLATNRLLEKGARVFWAKEPLEWSDEAWAAGARVTQGVDRSLLESLASELGLVFVGVEDDVASSLVELKAPTIGLYQSYVSNMAEGWTRWVLDQHEFDVETIHDADLRSGELERFDIIVFPDQDRESILNGHAPKTMPPEYTGGVGVEGAAALKRYVETGGWLLAFHRSVEFATSMLGLPVRNALDGVDSKSFFVPGSLIRFQPDPSDRLAYGMAEEATALFWRHGLAMDVVEAAKELSSANGEQKLERDIVVYARFPEEDLLVDGWAIGEETHLGGRPAALRAPLGEGQVVLIGFRPDTRGQSRNAFKLLFNPLYAATLDE